MDKVHVVFGSSTGMTEAVAARIAADLGTDAINVATVIGDVVRIDEANESDQTEKRVADLVGCIKNKM